MTDNTKKINKNLNNFNIIRLYAAIQVGIWHIFYYLNVPLPKFISLIIYYTPGVPIFFFVSGYLIFQSYSKNNKNTLKIFFINRFLRIYPALFFCFVITVLSIYLSGYLATQKFTLKEFVTWIFTSLTFLQFYNPDFLRAYGVGVVNGSLWTIPIEIQFYILTPLLFIVFKKYKNVKISIFIIFVIANFLNSFFNHWDGIFSKLIGVSFIPWFYMFMIGAFISANKKIQLKIMKIRLKVYVFIYILTYFLASKYNLGIGNGINFISYIILSLLVFKIAHTKPGLSNKLLKADISYGLYLYHMPIINFCIYTKIQNSYSVIIAIIGTVCISIISWYLIERPLLKLKKLPFLVNN
jgi:peptidoglycan/LPS O-acetylase OafA/YrhL